MYNKTINSTLFTEAHKMTKLTIKPNEKYRYKFGQWLIFLKTAATNQFGITNINQSVCYVPVLSHDGISHNKPLKTGYIKNNTFLLCLLAIQLIFIVLIFTAKF